MRKNNQTIAYELKHLLLLGAPLVVGTVVESSFSFIATILTARLGVVELAAGGLVTTLFVTIMIFLWGILISIGPLISRKQGAGDHAAISRLLKDGFILATFFSIPGTLLVWDMAPVLIFFGQKPEAIHLAEQYLHFLAWAVLPDLWALMLLQFVIGLGKTRLALLFNAVKVPITLVVSFLFMFGKFGLPKYGLAGLGIGITSGMWIATCLLLCYIIFHKDLRQYLFKHSSKEHYIFQILREGLPTAGMFCIEVGFLTVMALIMGRIDSEVLAANQITTQFQGFFTMVIAFAFSQAVGIRVGNAVGRRDLSSVIKIAYAGLLMVLGTLLPVAFCYWTIPKYLISIDLDLHKPANEIIIHYTINFLAAAAFVQIFNGARITLFGALRGLGENRFSMLTSLVIFWVLAFPIGLILTFWFHLGGIGMWIGMAIGTFVGAILLLWWLYHVLYGNSSLIDSKNSAKN